MEGDEEEPLLCGMCYEEAERLVDTGCAEKPEYSTQGQYHCPDCGMMVIGHVRHFKVCAGCLKDIEKRREG